MYQPSTNSTVGGFNPYPLLGAPSLPSWPRGLPLHMILGDHSMGSEDDFRLYQKESSSNTAYSNFAILQSLADIQPDVDAIYRLIRGTPFSFTRPSPIVTPSIRKCKLKNNEYFCVIDRYFDTYSLLRESIFSMYQFF